MINGPEYLQFRDHKIYPSTVGFFIRDGGRLVCRGSGTFVSIGKIHGLLTCAHALKAIEKQSQVHLALFPVRPAERTFPLNVKEHCDPVIFGPSGDEHGPDIGFLRLPIPFFSSISQLVSVKSLEVGRTDALATAEPSDESITAVVGMIHEWTEGDEASQKFDVRGLMNIGNISQDRIVSDDGYDRFLFQPVPDENFREPECVDGRRYSGTSGGGLWRIYPKTRDGSDIAYRLIGVAFYEMSDHQIMCHGQASIYLKLFDAIRDKWPDAVE